MPIRTAHSQQPALEIPAGGLDVSFSKIENSLLLILYIIVEAVNAAEPLLLSSSFCQGKEERGTGKELNTGSG